METSSVTVAADLSAKIIILCSKYFVGVAYARAEIERLKEQLKSLETTLRHANHLLQQPNSQFLSASRELDDPLQKCRAELQRLQDKLQPSATRKTMRRFGLRAAKWPFNKGEIDAVIASLVEYREAITAILQIDQTKLLLNINQRIENLVLRPIENPYVEFNPHFMIPFPPDPDFVDRPVLREWLEEQYNASPNRRIALIGMGGFGKSQVAIEFAYRVHIASPETSVFWVHGGTEAKFEESYRSLANALALPGRHDPNANVFALVRDWLQKAEAPPWLIILDNTDEMETFFPPRSQNGENQPEPLASYLPKTGNGKIIITSRNRSVAEKLTGSHKAIYEVPTMDSLEALKILENKLSEDIDQDGAIDLARALDFIPLAVNQAAAYINRRAPRVSIRSYLDEFRRSENRKKNLLNRDAGDLRRRDDVSNSVVITWQVTFEQMRHERPTAANLLLLMSFFQPQNIPEFMLSGYKSAISNFEDMNGGDDEDLDEYPDQEMEDEEMEDEDLEDEEDEDEDLEDEDLEDEDLEDEDLEDEDLEDEDLEDEDEDLEDEDLEDEDLEDEDLEDEDLDDEDLEDDLDVLRSYSLIRPYITSGFCDMHALVQFCTRIWLLETSGDNFARLKSLFLSLGAKHFPSGEFETLARCQLLLPHMKSLLDEVPTDESSVSNWCKLLENVSRYMQQIGDYSAAEIIAQKALDTNKDLLGDENVEAPRLMYRLGTVYLSQGRMLKGVLLFQQATETQGKWAEAKLLEMRITGSSKRVLEHEYPKTLESFLNLAKTHRETGRLAEAELLMTQGIEVGKKVLGDEHSDVLEAMIDLAHIFSDQGRPTDAELLIVQVIEIRKKALGDEHPDIFKDMSTLVDIYRKHKRLMEAEVLTLQLIEARKKALGDDHPDILGDMVYLADILNEQGKLMEAETLYTQVIESSKKVHGDRQLAAFRASAGRVTILSSQGRLDDAKKAITRCGFSAAAQSRDLGPDVVN